MQELVKQKELEQKQIDGAKGKSSPSKPPIRR